MFNPNIRPQGLPGTLTTAASLPSAAQTSQSRWAPVTLTSKETLTLALACRPQSRPQGAPANQALAPAAAAAVPALSLLNPTAGTASAALASLFPEANPLEALAQRVHASQDKTGQTFINHTSVLVRPDRQPILEQHYKSGGIRQEVVPLTPREVVAENARITAATRGLLPGRLEYRPQTVFVIANALYLKATWNLPFSPIGTAPAEFVTAAGQRLQVSTMTQDFFYAKDLDVMLEGSLQAVRLAYKSAPGASHSMSMVVVMKTDNSLQQPNEAEVAYAMTQLQPQQGHITQLKLPRFDIKSRTDLHEAFGSLGIGEALTQDQTRLPGAFVDEFTQECVIKVDEEGTEASAVTLLFCNECARPEPTRTLHFNRPFSAFVCLESTDKAQGVKDRDILFSAQVNDLPPAPRRTW